MFTDSLLPMDPGQTLKRKKKFSVAFMINVFGKTLILRKMLLSFRYFLEKRYEEGVMTGKGEERKLSVNERIN